MHKRNVSANFNFLQVLWDVLMVGVGFLATLLIYHFINNRILLGYHIWMPFLFALVFVLTMFVVRMYNLTTFYYLDRVLIRTIGSGLVAGLALSIVIFMLQLKETSRLFYVLFCVCSIICITLQRVVSRKLFRRIKRNRARLLFIGDQEAFSQYDHFMSQTSIAYHVVAFKNFGSSSIATPEAFERFIIANQIDEVVIVFTNQIDFPYKSYMTICEDMGITVRLVLDLVDMPISKRYINSIGTYPVITYHSVSMDRVQLLLKAVFDVVAAFFGLIITSPIMLFTAIAIKLESPGPVLFKQKRAGMNGREFEIWKFRSMYIDAEERKKELMAQNKIEGGLMFKMDNDPRVTKVGRFIRKTSIDELPQLFNVLKREMSLVGTRPPTLDEVQRYRREHRRRISIRPGITGMWQVSGRSDVLDFERVVELDNQYIDQWSFALDLKLLLRTFAVVVSRKGSC